MTPMPKKITIQDKKYLYWLKNQRCAVCGVFPCDSAHQRLLSGGTGKKPDDRHALPQCNTCHRLTEHGINGGVLTLWNDRSGMKFKDKHDLRDYLKILCKKTYYTFLEELLRGKYDNGAL